MKRKGQNSLAERVAERTRQAETHEFIRLSGVRDDDPNAGSFARAAAKKHGVPHAALGGGKVDGCEEDGGGGEPAARPKGARGGHRGRKVRIGETAGQGRRFLPGWFAAFLPILLVGGIVVGVCYFAMRPLPEAPPRSGGVQAEGSSTLWSPALSKEFFSLGADEGRKGKPISAQAAASAREKADRNPGDAQAQHNAGVAAQMLGEAESARAYYLRALALAPHSVRSAFNLAQLEFEEGNYGKAAGWYGKLREADPNHRILAYRALICALVMGESAEIDSAVLSGSTAPGLYARAALAWKGGDAERAREYVRKAREMGSKSAQHFEADLLLLGYFEG